MTKRKESRRRRWLRRTDTALDGAEAVAVVGDIADAGCAGVVVAVVGGIAALLGAMAFRNRK